MPVLTHTCPHCKTVDVGFVGVASSKLLNQQYRWVLFMTCPRCGNGIVVNTYDNGTSRDPKDHTGALDKPDHMGGRQDVFAVFPEPAPTQVPDCLPPPVGKSFREGVEIVKTSPNAACAMFRRALELGLRDLSPDIEAWKLEKRIDKMAAENLLTPAIRDWAHALRMDGNNAVHDGEDATVEFAQQVQELTRYVLLYLYTLPEQVKTKAGMAKQQKSTPAEIAKSASPT